MLEIFIGKLILEVRRFLVVLSKIRFPAFLNVKMLKLKNTDTTITENILQNCSSLQ